MALVRCAIHEPSSERTKLTYLKRDVKKPIGYPKTALICGIKGCLKEGLLVWLSDDEAVAYRDHGEEYFSTRSNKQSGIKAPTGAKVRVER
ncbi:MAG: hypothetical protein V1823_02230 [Chloroflexota bacterium]